MKVVQDPGEVHSLIRKARGRGQRVGCVPTMGALHPGHASLIERAAAECGCVVATIFVNPAQFGPNEDYSRYPRTLEADLKLCQTAGASLVLTPAVESMYAPDAQSVVRVGQLSTVLEGAHRPGHFDGVTTIVAKLFHITDPDVAYFGQKDFQQQLVIRQMVRDLNFPVQIVTCPIIREPDGMAMSSRNRYLSPSERTTAGQIVQALRLAESLSSSGGHSPQETAARMTAFLQGVPGLELQYAVVADVDTLQPASPDAETAVALVAARVGTTRLIDNVLLRFAPH